MLGLRISIRGFWSDVTQPSTHLDIIVWNSAFLLKLLWVGKVFANHSHLQGPIGGEYTLFKPLLSLLSSVAKTQDLSLLINTLSTEDWQGRWMLCILNHSTWFGVFAAVVEGVRGYWWGRRITELNMLNQRGKSEHLDYWIICEFLLPMLCLLVWTK